MATFTETEIGNLVQGTKKWNPVADSKDAEFTYIDLSSLDRDAKTVVDAERMPCVEAPSRARQLVAFQDVLVSTVRPNLNGVATVPAELDGATASTGFCVLRAKEKKLCWRYLFHWVRSPLFVRDMTRKATGASYPAVSDRVIMDSKIPLPPLEEQKRIAAILDKADAVRRKRQEAMATVNDLTSSQFLDQLGDPVGNPRQWPDATFNDHVTLLQYGPRFYNEAYSDGSGVRIVRITDLDFQGRLNYAAMPLMDTSEKDREKFVLKPGDLLLARSGATVGKTALIDERAPECIAGAYFIRLRFSDSIRPLYAQMVLRSKSVQQMIASRSQQSAQQNFNGPAIRALPLPTPPTEVQDTFIRFHSSAIAAGRRMAKYASEANDLFDSLVQRAFKGEL